VFIVHLAGFSDDQAYRVMDLLLDGLGETASEVFSSVAHLLNQNIVNVDATSTDWEVEAALTSWPRPCLRRRRRRDRQPGRVRVAAVRAF
jgi:hypothetical protein